MRFRRQVLSTAILALAACATLFLFAAAAVAQQANADVSASHTPLIKAQTRLVLVDTVVTDKKGNYIRDLTAKDFKVWEDNKEQPITSFSFEEDTGSPQNPQKRYLVLFFDNSTMDLGDQARARDAAAKFIDANSGPTHLMAIADFGGTVRIAQNFTADADRLKQVVKDVKFSSVSPNGSSPVEVASLGLPPLGAPQLSNAEAEFGVHTVMLALRSLAKSLASVPGRKTLVFLTSGFALTAEGMSELTAVIDTCNKANVAVYPIDVRGLLAPSASRLHLPSRPPAPASATLGQARNQVSSHPHLILVSAPLWPEPPQHGGGGGTGGGGTGGGGTGHGGGGTGGGGIGGTGGGGKGGTGTGGTGGGGKTGGGTTGTGVSRGGYSGFNGTQSPYNQPGQIVPKFPDSASTNQQVLYQLADGTGGFVIVNTNDLVAGLEKIAKDQSQYYSLGYKPPESSEGSCHTLRVKVERAGTTVRARSGYCNVRPRDLLAGNPIETDLEARASGEMQGNVAASIQLPFFYTAVNTARVNLAMDIPTATIKFEKVKGKQHAAINVLGIAYRPDNSIAARFSDTVNLDFDEKKDVQDFQKQPFHYENQFDAASGQYNLKVVFSAGNETFGKLTVPLAIDPYSAKQLSLSALALSNQVVSVASMATGLDAALLEDRTPLVVRGVQIIPSASNHFKKTDTAAIYVEIYDPALLASAPPKVGLEMRVTDRKSGEKKVDVGIPDTANSIRPGNPVIPLGLKLPVASLAPGSYRVELRALDEKGTSTSFHSADFEVE
jgi:VWFA-related protein